MITAKHFIFNPFQENTWLVYDDSKECIIFDPGCFNTNEETALRSFIEAQNLTPVRLINTHCHIDHILGNRFVADTWQLPLEIHKEDKFLLNLAPQSGKTYGVPYTPSPDPEIFLDESTPVSFGNSTLQVFHTPGHSPGSISFYSKEGEFAICGDVLFDGSIGRTDLPGGNFETLIESIVKKLLPLGDNVKIHSGHGISTTIGKEKMSNPFLEGVRK